MTQSSSRLGVSFEFFPPANAEMEATLWRCISRLAPVAPRFVSVTYGAGGSTRERTHATVSRIVNETTLHPAAHLTCVNAPKGQLDEIIRDYWQAGVRHIVALRGDPAQGVDHPFQAHPEGYQSTAELVSAIKKIGDFEVSVAAYPEKHPQSANFRNDLDILRAKIDAGAQRAITQFFFANADFLRYRDMLQADGIDIELVPGILPVINFQQVLRFSRRCGAHMPPWLADRFDGLNNDPETRRLIAAAVAAEQVIDLMRNGVNHFHFYTLNRADLVYAICHLMGVRPQGLTQTYAP